MHHVHVHAHVDGDIISVKVQKMCCFQSGRTVHVIGRLPADLASSLAASTELCAPSAGYESSSLVPLPMQLPNIVRFIMFQSLTMKNFYVASLLLKQISGCDVTSSSSKSKADDSEPQISMPLSATDPPPPAVHVQAQARQNTSDLLLVLTSFDRLPHSLAQTLLPLVEMCVFLFLFCFISSHVDLVFFFFTEPTRGICLESTFIC